MGVTVGDFNNDGFPDLYVTGVGRNHLYRNNGDGTFTDVTDKAGVAASGWSKGACFVDYDRDGHLDLIVTRYVEWDFSQNLYCGERREGNRAYCHPDRFASAHHAVYHNNGDGTFTYVSEKCGIGAVPSKGLGIAINDFDRDGWPDIVVANDSFPEQLFRNYRDGTFTDIATETGMAYDEDGKTFAGMGIDFADYDNDGWPDVFIDALANQRYAFYKNVSGPSLNYISNSTGLAGVSAPHSGWGAKLFDYDNDGWKDLFVAQGHVMDNVELTQPSVHYKERLLLARNRRGKFEDVSRQGGEAFQRLLAARGAAFGDLNNDGSIDIAINCNDGPAVVLMNRDGIGSAIRVVSGSAAEQHGYVTSAGSYVSVSDKRVHFGLGSDRVVKLLEINWPSGKVQQLMNVETDRLLTVKEPL